MDALDAWLGTLPVNREGHRILTLEAAKNVAQRDPSGWYATVLEDRYVVGKSGKDSAGRDRYPIVNSDHEPIRFPTFAAAATFLHEELGIMRVVKAPHRR